MVTGSASAGLARRRGEGLREALRRQGGIIASFVLLPRIEMVELLAASGFGAVIIDLEHGPIEVADLGPLVMAARAAGVYVIARTADSSAPQIGRVLDAGVDGLLVPHIGSADDAAEVARAASFPPGGHRSLNPYVRSNGYAMTDEDYAGARRPALIVMLEQADAIEHLELVVGSKGIDGCFLGPVDLSATLGLPGDAEHPRVVATVAAAIDRIRACDCVAGVYAPTPEAAKRWFEAGAGLVAMSADIAMAGAAFRAARAAVTAARPSANQAANTQ